MGQESRNWINNENRDTEAETLKHENMEAWNYGHRKSIYFSFCHGSLAPKWDLKMGPDSHNWNNNENGVNRST